MSGRLNGLRLMKMTVATALASAISTAWLSAADKLPTGTFVSGDWAVTFSADKTYHVTQSGEMVVEGTYGVASWPSAAEKDFNPFAFIDVVA